MPLNRRNVRTFHRRLYGGELQTVKLLKRNDDQQQGTVRTIILYQCRRGSISKTGESLFGDVDVGQRSTWHIPSCELRRVGVHYLNPADRIVDFQGRYWAPLADQTIEVKLFESHLTFECERVDPPEAQAVTKTGI